MTTAPDPPMDERARRSGGHSHEAIYSAVAGSLPQTGGRLVDVGCGGGAFWAFVRRRHTSYIGVDGVAFDGLPGDARLVRADLDAAVPLATGCADAVVSIETVEHLENPRAFVRELSRIARPGAVVIMTTPNQLSALSLLTLVVRQQFASFQEVHYPAHRTALLAVDLRRIAAEAGLQEVTIEYTLAGRIILTARHYPRWLARLAPRLLSDTVMLISRKPHAP